jgi:gas vesicle protein
MFIGSLMTLFSSVAYLFSGKHGMFFNMPFEREKNLNKNESSRMFKNLDKASILKSGDDKILIKSGWSKFAAAFGFAYFIPVDKLTYGTQFYITERSSFVQRFQYFFFIMLIMIFIGTLPSAFQGGSSGIAFGIIFGIIMYLLFAKRIYNEEYQTDPFPNMSSLLDKYRKYYRGSEQNKMQNFSDGFTRYKSKKETISYDDLSKEIGDIKKLLEKEIEDYSVAYKKVNNTLELNDDPFTKKLKKAKELKDKLGEGVSKVGKSISESKVGKFVSKKTEKVKERFFGKKPNPEN